MNRAESEGAANALIESRRIPREIEMYDHRRFLKIQPFAQQIGRDEQLDSLGVAHASGWMRRELRGKRERSYW